MATTSHIDSAFIRSKQQRLVEAWRANLASSGRSGDRRTTLEIVDRLAGQFIGVLVEALQGGHADDISAANWAPVRTFLEDFSRARAAEGFTADQTASFIFSFKKAVFDVLQQEVADSKALVAQMWTWTELVDSLGLHTASTFTKSREDIIRRQQADLLELSTPVIKLWDGVLALPMIGTLDSARTQVVMETLLQRIVETGSQVAILDITGVPTVDTLVAQHLMKTVTAIRLMGAECIISGIRPQIAQTIVHLGVDLGNITTKANLADALKLAMQRTVAPTGTD